VRYKAVIKVSAGMKSRLHVRLGKDLLGDADEILFFILTFYFYIFFYFLDFILFFNFTILYWFCRIST